MFNLFRGALQLGVLNLIINGLPSKHCELGVSFGDNIHRFKPYYKWITF